MEVLQPGDAVVQAAWAVARQPQLAMVLDEGPEVCSELGPLAPRHRRQPAVLGKAGPRVAAHQSHQRGCSAELVLDEVAVGAPRAGACDALDGVCEAGFHAA